MALTGTIIGHGSFGEVRRYGNHAPYVAVKSIRIHCDKIKTYSERELKTLMALEKLSHSNIVKFYTHNKENREGLEYLKIYMEFCERLSLKHVFEDPTVVYNLKTVFGWAEHLASALLCLKKNKILHRDIKPENVFVTNRFILKLGDFGLVKELGTGSLMSRVGTERYMSPEASSCFGNAETNHKSDLYAMGLVLWEIVERRRVFSPECESQGIYAIFDHLKNGRYTLSFTGCDAQLKDLILQCTRFDHNSRQDIENVFDKIAHLNFNYNEEKFQPLIQINQQEIQKPNCIRKEKTNERELLQKELTDRLDKGIFGIAPRYTFFPFQAHLDDEEQEEFINKKLNDAISMLKSLAIQQGDSKLLEMLEKRIQNLSKFPDDYVFCNDKYPNFPSMIDQELLNFLTEQKYEGEFVESIKSALKMCEQGFRNDFKTWLIETLSALDWHCTSRQLPSYYLLEAIEQIHSIIGRISDNPFYKQSLVVDSYETYSPGWGIEFLLSRKQRKRSDSQKEQFLFLHKGFHIESCLKDLQEILENLLKDTDIDDEMLKDYLQRYQPSEPVFPYGAYRFEWGKRVDECEEIKMSDIDPEILTDYESLRQAYECGLKILVTHSKRREKTFNKNDQISQIKTCLSELKKPRKCPNYFLFHARELKDDEEKKVNILVQNVNILCINQKEANQVTFCLGDDLIWRWKKTEFELLPPYVKIGVDSMIDLFSELFLKYESPRSHPVVSHIFSRAQNPCSLM